MDVGVGDAGAERRYQLSEFTRCDALCAGAYHAACLYDPGDGTRGDRAGGGARRRTRQVGTQEGTDTAVHAGLSDVDVRLQGITFQSTVCQLVSDDIVHRIDLGDKTPSTGGR